jgi:hypothetical protein
MQTENWAEKMDAVLKSPITGFFAMLIFEAIAASGKLSMTLTNVSLIIAFLVGCYGIYRAVLKVYYKIIFYLLLVGVVFFVAWWTTPSSEIQIIHPNRVLQLDSKINFLIPPFTICKNDSWENLGIRISVLSVKNKYYYKTLTERIRALIGKKSGIETKPVVSGTISMINGNEIKKFSSAEVGSYMVYNNFSIRVASIFIDSECVKFKLANKQ